MQRRPTGACGANFSKGRYRCEGRRTCRHHTIDFEVGPLVIRGDAKRTANKNSILATRIDEELAFERYRSIDAHRRDRSFVSSRDPSGVRLAHSNAE